MSVLGHRTIPDVPTALEAERAARSAMAARHEERAERVVAWVRSIEDELDDRHGFYRRLHVVPLLKRRLAREFAAVEAAAARGSAA